MQQKRFSDAIFAGALRVSMLNTCLHQFEGLDGV